MDNIKFLRIDFGDNDFGRPIMDALHRIWKDIHRNNYHITSKMGPDDKHFSDRSIADMFIELHKVGALTSMLNLAIDCEYMYGRVEFATRGLYWKTVRWEDSITNNHLESITDRYLKFDISFHKNNKFADEWNNSESAYLDLETGEVKTF